MVRIRAALIGGIAAGAVACSQDSQAPLAPTDASLSVAASAVADQYIVVFNDGVRDPRGLAQSLARAHGGSIRFTYEHAIKGFAAQLPAAGAAAIARNPNVALVEADQVMHAWDTQSNATWGLDRVDQRDRPLSGSYTYNATGAGVTVYIIDTGILTGHSDFGGRASIGHDALGGNGQDCNGHGTHVAGTVGGTKWGVAKGVSLVAVRVLDCNGSGTTSGVIAGVEWVTANHSARAAANMSLGGGASSALDQAVTNSIDAGVSYAVASGNGDFLGRPQNACNYSPARVPKAMTIGATDSNDQEASWSNYGSCVDMLAPGVSITSAWSDGATKTISGTSMATPHIAGAMALILEGADASPASVETALESNASTAKIGGMTSTATPNLLLYTLAFGGGGGGEPPSGGIVLSATGYKVQGRQHADLTWSGATSSSVDVFRNNVKITTTANNGAYTDAIGQRGGGSYTYRICEAGSSVCSNQVTVSF